MSSCPLPQWYSPTQPIHGHTSFRRNGFSLTFNSIPGVGISLGSFVLIVISYMTFLSPHGPLFYSYSEWTIATNHAFSSASSDEASPSPSDALSLEQIRDIVAPTRGFLSRDYSLYLGWNNVSILSNLTQAELIISE